MSELENKPSEIEEKKKTRGAWHEANSIRGGVREALAGRRPQAECSQEPDGVIDVRSAADSPTRPQAWPVGCNPAHTAHSGHEPL